eukprot:3577677-Amphidinium_carterae.1
MGQLEAGCSHCTFSQSAASTRNTECFVRSARRYSAETTTCAEGFKKMVGASALRLELPPLSLLQLWVSHCLLHVQGWTGGTSPNQKGQPQTNKTLPSHLTKPWELLEHQLAKETDPEIKAH